MGGVFFDDIDLDVDQQDKFAAFQRIAELQKSQVVTPTKKPQPTKPAGKKKKIALTEFSRKLSTALEAEEPPSPRNPDSITKGIENRPLESSYTTFASISPSDDSSSAPSGRSMSTENFLKTIKPSMKYYMLPTVQIGDPDLTRTNAKPTVAQCVTHLKFLHACHELRQRISNTGGLFGIPSIPDDTEYECLAREKRWAVFIARAVDRFFVWWEAQMKQLKAKKLSQTQMQKPLVDESKKVNIMEPVHLMPLDILMVWHTFMLNPRAYLEDCLRLGAMALWYKGFPWELLNQCIDNATGEYNPPESAISEFQQVTPLNWDNLLDDQLKSLECPCCSKLILHPYTTSGANVCESPSGPQNVTMWRPKVGLKPDILSKGTGYADRTFSVQCPNCNITFNHSVLKGQKFKYDLELLLNQNVPMPGTILTIDGEARVILKPPWSSFKTKNAYKLLDYRLFPNRLLTTGRLATPILEKLDRNTCSTEVNYIEWIRVLVEHEYRNRERVIESEKIPTWEQRRKLYVSKEQRITIRRMLSRYWDNSSPFALDLVGAVIRQGEFIRKMVKIDWLHSPSVKITMENLILKYTRFMKVMASRPGKMTVPTLDVDLAWHTHQLSPQMYYDYTRNATNGRFVDHDDKVQEVKLSTAFAETSKAYQKMFKEPYSLCTCWYCEATRASHTKSMSRILTKMGSFRAKAVLASAPPDPGIAPHISTHNAVRPTSTADNQELAKAGSHLCKSYTKASERARKDGRIIGTKEVGVIDENGAAKARSEIERERKNKNGKKENGGAANDRETADVNFYGYAYVPILIPGPPVYYGCGSLYPCNVSCASTESGAVGNCAAGTCGGNTAIGGCEVGGCTGSSGLDSSASGTIGGCSGGCGGDGGGCGGCGGCGGG